jgi:asparagine synthase (glutamine-hydrolysing)
MYRDAPETRHDSDVACPAFDRPQLERAGPPFLARVAPSNSMSGYAVLIRPPAATVVPAELRALVPALLPRGPHGTSVVSDGEIGIVTTLLDTGDRRLAPAWVHAGQFVVAGQVRVDAREALVDALRGAGTNASVHDPDVRLFAQAWLTWKDDAPARVLGDYSVVVHDRTTRATSLVRDPFGVRMLYYHRDGARLVASNTLAAVLDAGAPRDLDEDAIADMVAEGWNEDPTATVFRAIRRVPPAHVVQLHRDRHETSRRYWSLPALPIDYSRDAKSIVAEFRAVLESCVRDRIRTPTLTVFMSGGLDSTTLAAIAARALEDRTKLVARTSHLPTLVPSAETRRAQIVAESFGIPHVLTDVDGYGYREGTSLAVADTPEPVSDPDVLALQDELRRANVHSPVAFWGEDPDSLLAPPGLGDLLRGGSVLRVARDVLGFIVRERRRPYLAVMDLARGRDAGQPDRAGESVGGPVWLRADLRRRRAARLRSRVSPSHPTRSEVARRMDATHWQPFLESLDAGVTGVPIDVRLPYLDRRLIELVLALPPIPWMQRKHVLREAMRGLVPDIARCAPKEGMRGLYEARLAQWWSREPKAFVPSDTFARFVDVDALPQIERTSSVNEQLVHLRLRLIDRWLRAHDVR